MSEAKQTLFVERVAKTEWITFQRTEQLNAMSTQMLREMAAALESALADDGVRRTNHRLDHPQVCRTVP